MLTEEPPKVDTKEGGQEQPEVVFRAGDIIGRKDGIQGQWTIIGFSRGIIRAIGKDEHDVNDARDIKPEDLKDYEIIGNVRDEGHAAEGLV